MAHRERDRLSGYRPFLVQIVRATAAMPPERQLIHLYTEMNRICVLLSEEIERLRARVHTLEDERSET